MIIRPNSYLAVIAIGIVCVKGCFLFQDRKMLYKSRIFRIIVKCPKQSRVIIRQGITYSSITTKEKDKHFIFASTKVRVNQKGHNLYIILCAIHTPKQSRFLIRQGVTNIGQLLQLKNDRNCTNVIKKVTMISLLKYDNTV